MTVIFDFTRTDYQAWITYTVVLLMMGFLGFVIIMGFILTIKRLCHNLKREEKAFDAIPEEGYEGMTAENPTGGFKNFLEFLKRDRDYEMVTMIKGVMGNYSHIGLRLEGGLDKPTIPGDPGIFVQAVKPNSPADGKLGPGDRILMINGERVTRVPRQYAEMLVKSAESSLRFYIKRAPKRQKRIYSAMDDYEGIRNGIFTKQQFEEIEDGFSVFDRACKGRIKTMDTVQLVRCLGYNLHEAEVWVYMNELGYTGNTKVTLPEIVRLIHLIVTEHESFENEIKFAYSVFDTEDEGHISVEELQQAFDRMSGREKAKEEEFREIRRLGDKDGDGKLEFRGTRMGAKGTWANMKSSIRVGGRRDGRGENSIPLGTDHLLLDLGVADSLRKQRLVTKTNRANSLKTLS